MTGTVTKATLLPQRRRLVEVMQRINFGRIEGLVLRDGEPVFDPPPRVLREVKIGGENGWRPEFFLDDFSLMTEVIELLDHLSDLGNATVHCIEIKHGLPFKLTVEEDVA